MTNDQPGHTVQEMPSGNYFRDLLETHRKRTE